MKKVWKNAIAPVVEIPAPIYSLHFPAPDATPSAATAVTVS
ncbi:hypothetical protein ACQCWA_15745 [Rossellomorea aquimaris]